MSYANENVVYSNSHGIDVISRNGVVGLRQTLIKVTCTSNCLQVRLRDLNDFAFNFIADIDRNAFEKMRADQCLDICYEEFRYQLVDLLKQTLSKDMLLRLETVDAHCKMVFYEKSRIKSLIFLIVDLRPTDLNEIINEMAGTIVQMKDTNTAVTSQLSNVKCQLQEKDRLLNTALTTNRHFEKQFCQDIKAIENAFVQTLHDIQTNLCVKMEGVNQRHAKLVRDLELVRRENKLKGNAFVQTLHQLEHVRRDNEKQLQTIGALKAEVENLNFLKVQLDRSVFDSKQAILKKEKEADSLNRRIAELNADIQQAAVIIAQKDKTHDEIARDLVQANTMLVTFNNQRDALSQEVASLRQAAANDKVVIREQGINLATALENLGSYKRHYNEENMNMLRHNLLVASQKIEELEKQNREAAKINGLLTNKLSNGEVFDVWNMNRFCPK